LYHWCYFQDVLCQTFNPLMCTAMKLQPCPTIISVNVHVFCRSREALLSKSVWPKPSSPVQIESERSVQAATLELI
jgi:hypothetical protein